MTLLLGGARLRVEVDQRGAVTVIVTGEGETARGGSIGARLLTCTAATSRWTPGGGGGGGEGESAATRRRQATAMAAVASALFASKSGAGVAFSTSTVSSYVVARRGCGAGDRQLGAVGVVPLMSAASGAGNPATLAAVAAAWLPDIADDDMDALGDKHDAIGTRLNAAAGGGSVTGTAACGAWTLSGARTRAITRAAVAAEVAPPPPTQQQQQQEEDGEEEEETGMEVVARGPRGPPPTGTGATNPVALRLLRWVAAASACWRPAETASVHQLGDYCDADESEGEGQSGRVETTTAAAAAATAAAAAAAAARAAMGAATLHDVLAVLNAAPRTDEEPVGRDTNLMEAGFDSLQVMDLRRQLQSAAPAGTAALTASALMEHPTAAGLVAHMMQTWHPSPAVTAAAARRDAPAAAVTPRRLRRRRRRARWSAAAAAAAGGCLGSPSSVS